MNYRRLLTNMICLIVILPLIPFYLLDILVISIHKAIGFVIEERSWPYYLIDLSDKIMQKNRQRELEARRKRIKAASPESQPREQSAPEES